MTCNRTVGLFPIDDSLETSVRFRLLTVLATTMLLSSAASGQVLDLSFDLNTPASQGSTTGYGETLAAEAGLGVSLGFFKRPLLAESASHRLGLILGRQQLTVRGSEFSRGTRYTTFNIQGSYDVRLAGSSRFNWSAGLAAGLSFLARHVDCNEPFCSLPGSYVLVSPNTKLAVRISSLASGFLEVKGAVFMNDSESTFPFRSGAIVAIGIEIFSRPRSSEPQVPQPAPTPETEEFILR